VEVDVAVVSARGYVDAHAAETGDAGHHRVYHALRQRAGNGGIYGIAAGAQDIRTRLRGLRLRRTDHGVSHRASPQ